jgi:RNA recognition motif-containing protein
MRYRHFYHWLNELISKEIQNFMKVKLYVGNLSYSTTEDDLRTLFAKAGQVASVALIKDRDIDASTGFAFVEMNTQAEAQKAVSLLNSSNLEDRMLKVNLAKPHVDHTYRNLSGSSPAPLDKNYHQRPLHLASRRLNQGLFQGVREVVRDDLTTWGGRKSYRPDRYNHLAENTGEPLSRMGDDG